MNRIKVGNKLISLGGRPTLGGFDYVLDALEIMENSVTKPKILQMYKDIAKKRNCRWESVEWGIRNFLREMRKNEKAVEVINEYGPNGETLYLLLFQFQEEGME